MPSLDAADAELARWRDRLAAASRNVSELADLPEFALAKRAATGAGRLAEEARLLAATLDELWQGVLLIGGALDRAERARQQGSRLWRGEEAAAEAMAILQGASITVDLADTPVLHRRLLAGPRATATVSPETLLTTLDAAFDRARERLARIADATARADALEARLTEDCPPDLSSKLAAALLPDPLDRLDALAALAPAIDTAAQAAAQARSGLNAAGAALAALQARAAAVTAQAASCLQAVATALPATDPAVLPELTTWLDRLTQTLSAGRGAACLVGLANWRALQARAEAEVQALDAAALAALARRDELAARLGALRSKHRARPAPALDLLEQAARAALRTEPVALEAVASALAAYEAALAGR